MSSSVVASSSPSCSFLVIVAAEGILIGKLGEYVVAHALAIEHDGGRLAFLPL